MAARIHLLYFILVLTLYLPFVLSGDEEMMAYAVSFAGIEDPVTLELLKDASKLISLQKHPPKTRSSLRRRAESDIPNLVKALHSRAYYNARVAFTIDFETYPVRVEYSIEPGPVYLFGSFVVDPEWLRITPKDVKLRMGEPGYAQDIFSAEEALMLELTRRGYPLAKFLEREVIADQASKELHITLFVDPGPLALFGETTISGNCTVKDVFIKKKIEWSPGQIFNPEVIECTMNRLESAGVFSMVNISHVGEIDDCGRLPMKIEVTEGKQRSLGLGVGYSTQRGPGFTGEWEHRNFRGKGEKLRVLANGLKEMQEGSLTYLIPDFLRLDQDLIYSAEVDHNDTKGFEMTSFSLSLALERQLGEYARVSIGGMYEYLKSTEERRSGSKKTEAFNLARIPIKYKWSSVDDPLDPSHGAIAFFKMVPTFQLFEDPFIYVITTLTGSIYKQMLDKRLILAARAQFSSIWGTSRDAIPGSDRLYAGSENTLRGYNYYTVSPISEDADPIGGRSLMIYTLEGRWKVSENWGAVLFYDIGNVFQDIIPKFDKKMLQSAGIGVRYYTPVGPLRLDIAYPLNRRRIYDRRKREKVFVDDPYQIYFSVGQSF